MRGWVYIIINRAMPGLLKVGYSHRDPVARAGELDGSGMPHPYVVAFDVLVHGPETLEKEIHAALSDRREGKEWFRIEPSEVVQVFRRLSEPLVEYMNPEIFPPAGIGGPHSDSFNTPQYASCIRCGWKAQWGTPQGPMCDKHYRKWKHTG